MKKVFVNGCFDLLHAGHFNFFQYAAAVAGDDGQLIVGIDSDDKLRFDKGPKRPYFSAEERADTLLSLNLTVGNKIKKIDKIFVFDSNKDLDELIKEISPDILVKGEAWRGNVVGYQHAKKILYYSEDKLPISSTQIKDRILMKHGFYLDIPIDHEADAEMDKILNNVRSSRRLSPLK